LDVQLACDAERLSLDFCFAVLHDVREPASSHTDGSVEVRKVFVQVLAALAASELMCLINLLVFTLCHIRYGHP
jgi:hypothetical protein